MDQSRELELYLEKRKLPGSVERELRNLSRSDATAFGLLLSELAPSASLCRVFLELSTESAKKSESSLAAILERVSLAELANDKDLSRQDKQQVLRKRLERMRFPEKARIEDRLKELEEQLLRDTGLRVELPKNLEGDSVSISLKARSPEALAMQAEKLKSLAENPALGEIFQVLLGDY